MKIRFYFNKEGFTFPSKIHKVSKQTFWVRGARLRKQHIYEQVLPNGPLCVYADISTQDTKEADFIPSTFYYELIQCIWFA